MSYVGAKPGSLQYFYGVNQNACGHAAAATCLKYLNKLPYPDSQAVKKMYDRSPPDTNIPVANFNAGCTPGHVENICKLYGLHTSRFDSRGGTNKVWGNLQSAIRSHQNVILLVDNGKLNGSWGDHYIVAYGYDENAVYCQNVISMNGGAKLPNKQFDEAWHTWFIPYPEFHYSGIVVAA
jgi:hypothetical protein